MTTLNFTTAAINTRLYGTTTTLNLSQGEPIVGDGTYKSPSLYIQAIPGLTENLVYISGSLTYIGAEDIELIAISTITVSSTTAGNMITVTGGTNGIPNLDYEIANKITNANDIKEITNQGKISMITNDTLDFFIKADNNIIMEKAVWMVEKVN